MFPNLSVVFERVEDSPATATSLPTSLIEKFASQETAKADLGQIIADNQLAMREMMERITRIDTLESQITKEREARLLLQSQVTEEQEARRRLQSQVKEEREASRSQVLELKNQIHSVSRCRVPSSPH